LSMLTSFSNLWVSKATSSSLFSYCFGNTINKQC
jgi:hypothetical protein